jgi:hypothetical protein
MPFAYVAGAVGVAAGVNSLTGGGVTKALGMGPDTSGGGGGAGGQYDPYGPYRGQAASQLQQLMQNPALAMAQPGYQQQLQQGMQATERGLAARGGLQSGQEQAALQSLGQNTFASYYNSLTSQLEQLSGASQNPAQANLAAQQAAASQAGIQQAGMGTLASGLSTLGGLYNASSDPYKNAAIASQQYGSGNVYGYGGGGQAPTSGQIANAWYVDENA